MTDDEAATLLGIAYQALDTLGNDRFSVGLQDTRRWLLLEIALLRHRTPEDIQNEFEGKAGKHNEP